MCGSIGLYKLSWQRTYGEPQVDGECLRFEVRIVWRLTTASQNKIGRTSSELEALTFWSVIGARPYALELVLSVCTDFFGCKIDVHKPPHPQRPHPAVQGSTPGATVRLPTFSFAYPVLSVSTLLPSPSLAAAPSVPLA